ncbi:MAG: ATP-binding protein [Candidatus Hodarchaeales archaeon]|jgi:signal transduction histidine kinase
MKKETCRLIIFCILFLSLCIIIGIIEGQNLSYYDERENWTISLLPIIIGVIGIGGGYIIRNIVEKNREFERWLKFFMNSPSESFMFLDSKLNLVKVNRAALNKMDITNKDIIGKNLRDLFIFSKTSPVYDKFMEVMKKGEFFSNENCIAHTRYGEIYLTLRAFRMGNGLGIIAMDTTVIRKATEEAINLKKRQADFISITTHEIRTPLTAIDGYFSFIEDHLGEINIDDLTRYLTIIRKNIDRLKRLVSSIDDLSMINHGKFKLNMKKIDFFNFIDITMDLYRDLLGEKRFNFSLLTNKKQFFLKCDDSRLFQAISIIVENAIKHTDNNDRMISVIIETFSDMIRIFFYDNGAGISTDNLKRIYEPFSYIHTEYSVSGLGIDLFIAKHIIEKHGGTLTTQSEGLGRGSTFIVELPNNTQEEMNKLKKKEEKIYVN